MAMKVNKTAIHRLSVDMSCGCRMYAEFEDAQCKKPMGAPALAEGEEATEVDKVFKACPKHATDASLSMLEFIISERLDEAVEAAQKEPAVALRQYATPGAVDIQSTLLSGATVQSVATVKPEVRQRARPEDPTKVKVLNRSGVVAAQDKTAIEMGMEAEEDEGLSASVEDVLSDLADLERDDARHFQ